LALHLLSQLLHCRLDRRRRIVVAILLVALCATAADLLDLTSPSYYLQTESRLRDTIARSGRTTPANPNLLFLAIDSDSVSLDETLDLEGLFSSSSGPGAYSSISNLAAWAAAGIVGGAVAALASGERTYQDSINGRPTVRGA